MAGTALEQIYLSRIGGACLDIVQCRLERLRACCSDRDRRRRQGRLRVRDAYNCVHRLRTGVAAAIDRIEKSAAPQRIDPEPFMALVNLNRPEAAFGGGGQISLSLKRISLN